MKNIIPILVLAILSYSCKLNQQASDTVLSKWEKTTQGLEKFSGFMDYYYDAEKGKVFLKIDQLNTELLYVNYLSAGIGSNDIGLDRGKIGDTKVIEFKRMGNKVMMFQPNYGYRASTDNPYEEKAVKDAFSHAIIHAFTIEAEQDWAILVDATDFFLSDRFGVATSLSNQKEGVYSFKKEKSAFHLEGSANFPQNTELDFWISFEGKSTGRELYTVSPDVRNLTVRQHHSFVKLPDEEYQPRKFDPRAGYFSTSYKDYSVPIEEDITQRLINRHRLQKVDPSAELSEVVEPIIYYLDPGTPEPIRSALMEGALWWNEAFEAAGYKDAFQVKILPEDVDPLDIRYNVIQWVHRSTRGWSYGMTVTDPRTGEIIKGHVSLGSLRVRQDYLIATGLLSPFTDGNDPRMIEMALARLRQLAAHEVGHTLGLAHNYIASIAGDASVMDYPHPNIKLDNEGKIDISEAYDKGIGEWDKIAIQYGYGSFENEDVGMNTLLMEAYENGLRFISDKDARDTGGAHAYAHLWDNGENPAERLEETLKIRRKAIEQMNESVVPDRKPLALIEDALIPIYFMHRYQLEAAVKMIGGMDYNYKLRGDKQESMSILSAELQMQAVNCLVESIKAETLAIPESLLSIIHPRPLGYYDQRELLNSRTIYSFDALGAAEQAASATFELLFHPARLARLNEFKSRDAKYPGIEAVLNSFTETIFYSPGKDGYLSAIQRSVQYAYVMSIMKSLKKSDHSPTARAVMIAHLKDIRNYCQTKSYRTDNTNAAFGDFLQQEIQLFYENPKEYELMKMGKLPPGSPIGQFCE